VTREEATQINDSETPVEDTEQPADETTKTPVAELEKQLEEAQQQAKANFEGWQRERADFSNYKKRVEREMKEIQQNATSSTLMALLPVLDDFERAMSNLPEDLKGQPWLDGVSAIQRKFQKILDDYGIVILDPVGEVFDPSRHEALGTDTDTTMESGHITVTLQKGYASGDRVLRPALVRVAS
jgi:molecular chaperone GrpE